MRISANEAKCRNIPYDILRVLSCITVVILHVSSIYTKQDFKYLSDQNSWYVASFWRTITNLAVPSFVMLSGAFLIDPNNVDYKVFYCKMYKRIIKPTFFYSLFYVGFKYTEIFIASKLNISGVEQQLDIFLPLKNWLRGQPIGPMWYMYMIIGLYLLTPVISLIRERISDIEFGILSLFLMVYGILVSYTNNELNWIIQFVPWLGYFFLGYSIRMVAAKKNLKNNWGGVCLILLAYLLQVIYWMMMYKNGSIKVPLSFSLVVVTGTLLQFCGFSVLKVEKDTLIIRIISLYSMEVYLIHPLFCELLMQFLGRMVKYLPNANGIPFYSLVITFLCIIVAASLKKITSTLLG